MSNKDDLDKILLHVQDNESDLDVYEENDWSENAWRFMFAVILSSQTTDIQVNKITPALFAKFPTIDSFATATEVDVQEYLKTIPFFRNKARALIGSAKMLLANNSEIPDTLEDLIKYPGCGEKVASVILSYVKNKPAIVVDTHVMRVAQRLKWTTSKYPSKIKQELESWIASDVQIEASTKLVLFGRYTCRAKKPLCIQCPLNTTCPSIISTTKGVR